MKQKLSPKKLELYEFIEKLLYEEWNPIGVDDLPEDEYDIYVPHTFSLAINRYSTYELAEYLLSIETDMMSLKGNREHCLDIAEKIVNKMAALGLKKEKI